MMETDENSPSPSPDMCVEVDLTTYCAEYRGHTLFVRLQFIAKKFPNMSLQAYELLNTSLKSSHNSKLYCDIFSDKSANFGSFEFDKAWVDETERKNHQHLERLEAEFSSAKSSMIKEAIRIAFNDLGHHFEDVGNLTEALRAFTRTRDYTSMPRHTEEMILNVCKLAVSMQRTFLLGNYLEKSVEENASSPLQRDKFRALSGILSLSQGDFASTARHFASVESNIIGNFGNVISAEDIALGAVTCGMAALERTELQALLLENPRFKPILDLVPHLRELLNNFLAGKYAEVKSALQLPGEVRKRLELDIYFHSHAEKLFEIIQDKLVLQYFRPYNVIRMSRAVDDLYRDSENDRRANEEELESHVWRLIEEGKLAAKIDAGCEDGSTLRRVQVDKRALALQAVCDMSKNSSVKIQQAVLRLSLLKNSFTLSRGHHIHAHPQYQQRNVVENSFEDFEGGEHMDIE